MSSNYFQLYTQQVLQLAQTLVIKSQATADGQNKWVSDMSGGTFAVDTLDPTTWKYYLNLAGDYHPMDAAMTVVSLDTLDEVVFSKQNLQVHRATARAYQFGTRQYKELVARYPDQERLIRGILYPVDIDAAIAADDFQILGYPPGLVEDNEYSLIANLQTWINRFRVRWINEQFAISDPLYMATALAILYALLVPAIISLRLQACKTNEAHSFHVRQYLASHGFLDQYFDKLTLKQRLFFYRNIAYIERNAGKRDTFEWLVEHIMTERSFPIAEYVMRHDLSGMPASLYPSLVFEKNQLNLSYAVDGTASLSLEQILTKEDQLARDNALYHPDALPKIQRQMENSLSNVLRTKLLESSMIDYSNSAPHTLAEVLVNEWLSQAAAGTYTAYVTPANPKSGELMPLTVKEAFIFTWWIFCKQQGMTLDTIPTMVANHVQRTPMATVNDIWSVVDHTLVARSLAVQALSLQPVIPDIISIDTFYDVCVSIEAAVTRQRGLAASQEHHMRRAMVANMIERIYADKIVELEPAGTTYASWFSARNMKVSDWSDADLTLLYNDIVLEATGQVAHQTTPLRDIQRAMIKMMGQLSSYSIQITSEINDSDVKRTDWTAVRVGDTLASQAAEEKFPDAAVGVEHIRASVSDTVDVPLGLPGQHRILSIEQDERWKYRIVAGVECHMQTFQNTSPLRAGCRVRLHTAPTGNTEGITPVPGYEAYLAMTQTQRDQVKDLYTSPYLPTPPVVGDLSIDLSQPVLNGLDYVPANAMRDADGNPIRDNDGNIITT